MGRSAADGERSQTQLDFLFGVTVFIVVVVATFSLLPSLVTPFAATGGAETMAADSIATQVVGDVLTDPGDRYVLDPEAVDDVFDETGPDLETRLGLDSEVSVNVTLDTGSDNRTVGPAIPESDGISTAWRVVRYEGDRATITVKTW